MIDNKRRTMIFINIVIFLCLASFVSANLLTELLSPFQTTNFSEIYDSYYSIIDFIIYLILFIGLSQVTIGKRFESRGGKAVVVAIGLVLAIGLAISESYIGFNLRSFGPLAATIFIFLVGFVIFLGIKSAGMESIGAVSITLVLTYFSIRSVSPSFFDYMINNKYLSWFHSVILIAVIISTYKIFRLFLRNKESGEKKLSGFFGNTLKKPANLIGHLKEEKDEFNFIKKNLEKITEEIGKDSQKIINDLLEIKKFVKEFGDSQKGRELISSKVESLILNEKVIHQKFRSLREMIDKISKFDFEYFEELQNEYKLQSANDKLNYEKKIKSEWSKTDVEQQMTKTEKVIRDYDKSFKHNLELFIISLKSNKINKAIELIDETIVVEKKILSSVRQLDKLERKIKRLFR